jgi:hypothetical protein
VFKGVRLEAIFPAWQRCKRIIEYTYETRYCHHENQARELTQTQGDCCLEARNILSVLERLIDAELERTIRQEKKKP